MDNTAPKGCESRPFTIPERCPVIERGPSIIYDRVSARFLVYDAAGKFLGTRLTVASAYTLAGL